MSTERLSYRRRFLLTAGGIGIGFLIAAVLFFYRTDLSNAEEELSKNVNYIRTQCTTYTYYNNASETQALLRSIESNKQVRENIRLSSGRGEALSSESLEQYAKQLWLHGIIVLNSDGSQLCSYAKDDQVKNELLERYSRDIILAGDGFPVRSYTQRIYLEDNSYINVAAAARTDAPGVVVTYYYISSESAYRYSLTVQNLLEGYRTSTDGTLIVVQEGRVIASNDVSLTGQSIADNDMIQAMQDSEIGRKMAPIRGKHSYGIVSKQRDYYVYGYMSDKNVFATLPQKVLSVMLAYGCVIIVLWTMLRKSEMEHEADEAKRDAIYKESLREAAQRAEAANMAKTTFLQRMSHDIRTPINGICGMIEVADHYCDDLDKQTECRSKIKDASHLLLELINEVLDMGKLESGEIVLDEQPFDLQTVLDEVLVVIERLAEERDISLIRQEYQVKHWHLTGSVTHIKRLLMNVMNNAVKYNKEHGTITISCRELESGQDRTALIQFTCSDTGIGMSPEYQKHVFEPFTQENTAVQSKYGGTGLGMSIVKGLVDKMHGTITMESEKDVGTTFVITIPFEIAEQQEEAAASATGGTDGEGVKEGKDKREQNTESEASPSISGYHILLAEDNELNMEIAEFVLEQAGAVVQKAWNGEEAVNIFERSQPGEFDAILMDLMMPAADGYEATGRIRSMDRADAETVPIIAMTANAFTEDRIRTRKAGMNAHIIKPIDSKQVIEMIYRLVKIRRNMKRQKEM